MGELRAVKILVVGASGFVGKHILRQALRAGHDAIGTQSQDRGGDLIHFDLTRHRLHDRIPRSWFEGGTPVRVVLSAAIPSPDRCRLERDLAYATNVTGALQLLRDAGDLGAAPVFLSSSFVFDGHRGNYGDLEARTPISEYGRHKTEVEETLERTMPDALVLRLDKTVGDDPAEHHLVTEFWKLAREGKTIRCIEGQDFSVTLVDDVARGTLLACERRLAGIYNVANPEHYTRVELARLFLEASGMSVPVEAVPQSQLGFADMRSLKSWLDSTRLMQATGLAFTPVRTIFESFLQKTRSVAVQG